MSSSVWALFIMILSSPSSLLCLLLPCIPSFDFLLNQRYIAGLHFQGPWWIISPQLTYHLSDSIGLPALAPCQPVMMISIIHQTELPTCMICLSSCSSLCWHQWQQVLDNSSAAGTQSLLGLIVSTDLCCLIVTCYFPASRSPLLVSLDFDNKLFGAKAFYSMLVWCFDLPNISRYNNNKSIVGFSSPLVLQIFLRNILCLNFLWRIVK